MNDIILRLEKLERENKRLRLMSLGILAVVTWALLTGQGPPQKELRVEKLVAREIVIEASNHDQVAFLGGSGNGGYLNLMGAGQGLRRVHLGFSDAQDFTVPNAADAGGHVYRPGWRQSCRIESVQPELLSLHWRKQQ